MPFAPITRSNPGACWQQRLVGVSLRRVLVVLFVLAAALVRVPSGAAQTDSPGLLLIMDASGSMNRDAGNGNTLLDEAKDALREIVIRLPAEANVGLRVYGHRTPNDDQAIGCVDTELVVPVGPIDRAAMTEAIDAFDASGFTPIGLSLQEAVADLGDAGGTIILVSDGVDTCAPPDPCEVARQLAEDGYITHIHTVGLFLQDQAAVDQLQCIADVGNGTFSGIDSTEHLFDRLSGVVTDVVEDPGFSLVVGSLTRELAPVLPWDFADDLPPGWGRTWIGGSIRAGETRWFAVDVDRDGYHLAADANLDWPWTAEGDEYLEVQIFDESGEPVGEPHVVAGILIEWPQRLYLSESADWTSAPTNWIPSVAAVTDSASMFPSWEPDEEHFATTVTRFRQAGYNGGIYHLWKRWNPGPPLSQGRYYMAVTWESDRNITAWSEAYLHMYPTDAEVDPWRVRRPRPPVVIDQGIGSANEVVEAEPWVGGPLSGPFGTPLRAVEVWSAIELDEPEHFSIDLAEGEWLVAGWDIEFMRHVDGWSPKSLQIALLDGPDAVAETFVPERDGPIFGYMGQSFFQAPRNGLFTVEATLTSDGGGHEPALALSLLVLPDVAEELLVLPDVAEELRIPPEALRAMFAGLDSVRRHLQDSND